MSSFGGARKYVTSRKQEIELKKELELIKKKAYMQRYQSGSEGSETPTVIPHPPFKPKPYDLQTRRRLSSLSPQKSDSQALSQTLTTDPTKGIKFAIASSLQTSSPVVYAKRESVKPVSEGVILVPEGAEDVKPVSGVGASKQISQGVEVTGVECTRVTSPEATSYHIAPKSLDDNFLSCRPSKQSSSFTSTSPGSDLEDTPSQHDSAQGRELLADPTAAGRDREGSKSPSPGHSGVESDTSYQGSNLYSRSPYQSSEISSNSGSFTDRDKGIESEGQDHVNDPMAVPRSGGADWKMSAKASRQSYTLKLEVDMRFKQEQDSSEQVSRLSSVNKTATLQTPEYSTDEGTSESALLVRSGGGSVTPITPEMSGESDVTLVLDDSNITEPHKIELQPSDQTNIFSQLSDKPDIDSIVSSASNMDLSHSHTSTHSLSSRRTQDLEFTSTNLLPALEQESKQEINKSQTDLAQTSDQEVKLSPSNLLPKSSQLSVGTGSMEEVLTNASSSYYMQSTIKGDMSTTLTGYHLFSESMSSMGLTLSIPSEPQFSNEGSSSHSNLYSHPLGEEGSREKMLNSKLGLDRLPDTSEHHLMTSSWLNEVREAQGSGPSSSLLSGQPQERSDDLPSVKISTFERPELGDYEAELSSIEGSGGDKQETGSFGGSNGDVPSASGDSREGFDDERGGERGGGGGGGGGGGMGREGGGGGGGGGGDDDDDDGSSDNSRSDHSSADDADISISSDSADEANTIADKPNSEKSPKQLLDDKPIHRDATPPIGVHWDMDVTVNHLLDGKSDVPSTTLAEFLAFSKGPVTLADIMKVTGKRLESPAAHEPTDAMASETGQTFLSHWEPNVSNRTPSGTGHARTTFLSKWDPDASEKVGTFRPSIHHFCTHPTKPQLPTSLLVLSRATHTKPGIVQVKSSQDTSVMEVSISDGDTLKKDRSLMTVGSTKCSSPVSFTTLASNKRKLSTSRQSVRGSFLSSSETLNKEESGDIVSLAKARLRREKMAKDVPQDCATPDGRKEVDDSVQATKEGVRSKGGQSSREGVSRGGQRSKADKLPSVHVEGGGMHLSGTHVQVVDNPGSLLWTPAAPKLCLFPATIQSYLFPQYESPKRLLSVIKEEAKEMESGNLRLGGKSPFYSSTPAFSTTLNPYKGHGDLQKLTLNLPRSPPRKPITVKDIPEMLSPEHKQVLNAIGRDSVSPSGIRHMSLVPPPDLLLLSPALIGVVPASDPTIKPAESMPAIPKPAEEKKPLKEVLDMKFKDVMEEVRKQRDSLISYHSDMKSKQEDDHEPEVEVIASSLQLDSNFMSESTLNSSGAFTSRKLQRQVLRAGKKAGLGFSTSRNRTIRRTMSAQMRSQKALEMISQPPRPLIRQVSYPLLADGLKSAMVQKPSTEYRRARRLSVPASADKLFPALMRSHDADPVQTGHYEWAFDLWWEKWFPQVLQDYRDEVAGYSTLRVLKSSVHHRTLKPHPTDDNDTKKRDRSKVQEARDAAEQSQRMALADIEPVDASNVNLITHIQDEVDSLSKDLSTYTYTDDSMRAVQYCRRGALRRKLGQLQESRDDLDKAISLQPTLSDTYWHRHLLFLLQDDDHAALDDLTTLLKQNKHHVSGFHSKAIILARNDMLPSALYNLSHAINLSPDDPALYLLRAEVYERRGEMESALTDYARVTELDPTSIEPLKKQAMHKFNKNMWAASTVHFTALLRRDPNNKMARIHRAKAQYKLGNFTEALQDLSASIHLEPNNHAGFYMRACLLRTTDHKQALKDFSVSLLLNHSPSNIQAFVHRGVLYTEMKWYDEALADFESASELDHSLPSPHVLAGLIHMNQKKELGKAVSCFTTAVNVDPTCIRAHLCRAEAYKKDQKYQLAVRDYTRVIHFQPDNPTYYLYRGETYLLLKEYRTAAIHIEVAAKLTTGRNQAKTQRALVESFLGNHQQAITLLRSLAKTPEICSLLGKVQYKARMFPGAAESFRQSIQLMDKNISSELKTQVHFMCGQSLRESGALKQSINQFNKVISVKPKHVKAYYERGMAKLKCGQGKKGVRDLNKTLAIDSNFYQSYLSRASYFGSIGHYTKAILNCNEAIRIQPDCVRAFLTRGSLKYQIGWHSGAIEDLSVAIHLNPTNSGPALFNRALCYQALGNPIKALADYSAVLLTSKKPGIKVLVNRGLLYLELKDHHNALLDITDAVKNAPNDPAVYQILGYCYHQIGSLNSSIEAYSKAISLDSTFLEAIVGRGNAFMDYLQKETNNLSKVDYLHALDLDPSHLDARVNLAFVLQAEGKFQEAWNELTSALQRDKHYIPALEARAIVCLQMGNLFESFTDLTAAIDIQKSATLLTNRGVVSQFMGHVVSAMSDYKHAIQLDPTHVLAHFNIANVLFHQRLFDQAITSYTNAISHCVDDDDSILLNRAIAYSITKQRDKAMVDFERAIEANPFSAHAYFNRGNLHKSMGDLVKAEEDYKKALELQPGDWLTLDYYGEVLGMLGRKESAMETFRKAVDYEMKQ